MKWFEHQADAGLNKKIRKIQRRFADNDRGGDAAMAAVGRYWRLLEVICLQGDDSFSLPAGYDLDLLADDLLATREYTEDFLNFLAAIGAIDPATRTLPLGSRSSGVALARAGYEAGGGPGEGSGQAGLRQSPHQDQEGPGQRSSPT